MRSYRFIAESGLFDSTYYLSQIAESPSAMRDPLEHYLLTGADRQINPNPLFDSSWYAARNPDVSASGVNPLLHFIESGWRERRDPHPLFDVAWYLSRYPDVEQAGVNPLLHFLSAGGAECRSPHLLFDSRWYFARNPDVAAARVNPLLHYLQNGWREDRDPHPLFHTRYYLRQRPELLEAGINPLVHFVRDGYIESTNPNHLFDSTYYRKLYPDITPETNSLVHYLLFGGAELRSTHPLFDPLAYCRQTPEMLTGESNPLLHYFQLGIEQRRSPHVLFDTQFYLSQVPALIGTSQDPVLHFLETGGKQNLDPCELFDTSFYVERYPEILISDQNALVHFVTEGSHKGYNPNPFFDTAYYLKQNADVRATGQNALVHYVLGGAFEGRSPSRFFDSSFYLKSHPQLRKAGVNPLAHYIARGAEMGNDPNPFFKTRSYLDEHPELKRQKRNPLAHFLDQGHQEKPAAPEDAQASEKEDLRLRFTRLNFDDANVLAQENSGATTVLCVSHISPIPPRAGNEYRLLRLSEWFSSAGYNFVPVLAPLPQESISEDQLGLLAARLGNAVLCKRDGSVIAYLRSLDMEVLSRMDGSAIPSHAATLNAANLTEREGELANTESTFCHDTLIYVARRLVEAIQPCIIVAEYLFMSRLLSLLSSQNLKVIDTHDVFSAKTRKVLAHGVKDSLALTADEESERLRRSDLVLAIQPEEREELECLCGPGTRVITVGVDFPVVEETSTPSGLNVVFIGSDNAMNARGLRDFLRFCWPSILSAVPESHLLVAGKICNTIRGQRQNVRLVGSVQDLGELYRQAKIVINPAIAGTGLKIKTLEALSYQLPIVTWPTGADGLHPDLRKLCLLASDWFDFSSKVTTVLQDSRSQWYTPDEIDTLRCQLSSRTAYAELHATLREWEEDQIKAATA